MENDITQIISGFRNSSSKIYETVYNDFSKNISTLSREKDENVFQQVLGGYVSKLKKELGQEAEKILERHQEHHLFGTMQREMTGHISYIVSSFLLKAKSI